MPNRKPTSSLCADVSKQTFLIKTITLTIFVTLINTISVLSQESWIISGFVRTSTGSGVSGVTISADNQGGSVITDSMGYYTLSVPKGWSGRVTPSMSGYTFIPPYKDYINVTSYQNPQEFTAIPISDGFLVAHWKLDETSGAIAYDSSGNGLDGILHGYPQWRPSGGVLGGALDFDGVNDYVDCGNNPLFGMQETNEMTVSAWVTIRSCANAWACIAAKGEYAWRLSNYNLDPSFHFGITWWMAPGTYGVDGATAVGFDEWHHVAGSFDSENINIYLDGLLDGSVTTTEPIGVNNQNVLIGNNPWDLIRFWDGLIDDVRIYNSALSQTEIESIMGKSNKFLVAHWKLDETSGAIAYDSSGNGLDGILYGYPQWRPSGGVLGGALDFDGVNDYVDTGYLEDLATWTIACWVISPFPPAPDNESGPIHREQNYQINWNHGSSDWQGSVGTNVGGWKNARFDFLEANTWYHLAGTYDGKELRAYTNGVLSNTNDSMSGPPNSEPYSLKIARHAMNEMYFTGTVDDVQVYNYALTEDEILDVMEGDMAPTPKVYYVDADATGDNDGSSWANAYVYLQDALTDANDARKPVEIRVAQGTYTPDCGNGYVRGDKQAKFLLKSGVTIKGGFAGVGADDPNAWDHHVYETVLSGDLSGNDERLLENFVENSDHVMWCIDGDASAVLDGFTITGGYATDRIGGGLLNYNANPTIKRCVFFDNYASQGGGMANRYSSPTVTDCTFDGNLAPYGGGGMYNDYGHPIVESCVFYDNWTWYLGGGGMYCGGSNPTITNCLFTDNGAPFGGGMYNAAANPILVNCTFSNNNGGAWGGGMQNDAGSNPTVTNCILWGDIPDEISFAGTATVTYSDVQGGWAGIGNIDRDPKFADSEGRLSAGSPCIDAGNNDAVRSGITTDLDGNPRVINGTVDMGAYEFGGTTP